MDQSPNEVTHLIDRSALATAGALAELFDRYRDRLRRMVELRMDPRLRTASMLRTSFRRPTSSWPAISMPIVPTPSSSPCSGCGCTSAGG